MIITVPIPAAIVLKEGRNLKWEKPSNCPKCSGGLWGHGYVFSNNIFLKRYRCNRCTTVITLKPYGFWKKYKTSIAGIYSALRHRLTMYQWHAQTRRQVALHWLKKFTKFTRMLYGDTIGGKTLLEHLDYFYCKNIPFLT